MPRGGAVTLADVREPTIEIVCVPCGRRGRYNVERLIAKHGADAKLSDLLVALTNCDKARSVSIYDHARRRTSGCKPRRVVNETSTILWKRIG